MTTPQFPPLFSGQNAAGGDPFALAIATADVGCEAGLVIYDLGADLLRVAIVFAPDVSLSDAAVILPICGVGLQNAIGALGPPEVSVHLGWDGTVYVNGGRCGTLRMAASGKLDVEPDWLVVELNLTLWPASDETGLTPDQTVLKLMRLRFWKAGCVTRLSGSILGLTAAPRKSTANGAGLRMGSSVTSPLQDRRAPTSVWMTG